MGIINNDSIEKVFSIIMQDENLQKELTKKKTIDEVYEFCTSISEGYTIEELKDFLSKAEEQFTKVSGGIKLNNKALSTVLATMAIASPLAGAAGQTQDQPQPSKISGFVKSIKEKISKHPAEAAMGGVATAGGLTLAAIKLFGNSSGKKDNGGSTDAPHRHRDNAQPGALHEPRREEPPVVAHPQNQIPSYLVGINPRINRYNEINEAFVQMPGVIGRSPADLVHSCQASVRGLPRITSRAENIKRILYAINGQYTGDMREFYFYDYKGEAPNPFNPAERIEINDEIYNKDFIKIDASDIDQLNNLVIKYKDRNTGNKVRLDLTNEQKAIIIRYVQASYLQEKGVL